MRTSTWKLALVALAGTFITSLAASDANVNVAPSNDIGCFEPPIVILSPQTKPFPTKHCVQAPLPSENCLKEKILVNVEVIDNKDANGAPLRNCMHDTPTNAYLSTSHYRGQSSLGFRKHQFSVKLHEAAPFLGFPEDKTFVLNGPVIDGSLIRNHLAQWLYRSTGRFSPRTRHIIVFLRDIKTKELEYNGVYLALERITYGPNRVGLATLDNSCNASALNGGWAWQMNPLNYGVYSPNVVQDQYQMMFGGGERPVLMYPKPEQLTQSMRDYFVDTSTGPLPQLYRYLFDRPAHTEELEQHIDLGSFADYMLHSELSQNSDAYRRSTYFFKDRDQPINAGPVWDFNLAYGSGFRFDDWIFKPQLFWRRLFVNYKFASLTIKRWKDLRAGVWKDEAIEAFIDEAVAPFKRQFAPCAKWHSRAMPCANVKVNGTYEGHVNGVKQAIKARAKWMDEHIAELYTKIDRAVWGPATNDLPDYNCGPKSDDDGCLKVPDMYLSAVVVPPVRKPYNGPSCAAKPVEEPSIDPCWLSAGEYIQDGSITTFCSGNGYCPFGPGAKCTCIRGKAPPYCGAMNSMEVIADQVAVPVENPTQDEAKRDRQSDWSGAVYQSVIVVASVVMVALVVAHRRRRRANGFNDQPLIAGSTTMGGTPLAYGTDL